MEPWEIAEQMMIDEEYARQEACFAAAAFIGLSQMLAEACEDGAHCCPTCPFAKEAYNWRPTKLIKLRDAARQKRLAGDSDD